RIIDPATGQDRFSFMAYDAALRSGVTVALGDMNGDGIPDIITAPGAGGGPHIRVFDGGTGANIANFFAYDPAFRGGVSVAAADLTGDGVDEIITGAGPGGGPHVKVFDGLSGMATASFFVFDSAYRGGLHVGATDFDGDGRTEIVAGFD